MPNIVSELATVQPNRKEQESTSSVSTNNVSANNVSTDNASTDNVKSAELSNKPAGTIQSCKLPYQDNHQVELLHLQAEIDALLQQLTTLKQQRLSTSDHSLEMQDSKLHAVV